MGALPVFVRITTALAAAVVLLVASSLAVSVSAQTPPYTAYGLGQRAGARIAANIAGRACGGDAIADAVGNWAIRIATTAACVPKEGETISFTVDGVAALQTVRWTAGGGPANAATGIALTTPPASSSAGAFSGGSIAPSGLSIVSFSGTAAQLDAAGASAKVIAVTATTGGRMLTYVIGAPGFVNTEFVAAFPAGLSGNLVIVKTGSVPVGSAAPPVTTPAPGPSPTTSNGAACPPESRPVGAIQAVVRVVTTTGNGTAFHIGGGAWLTAAHVVDGERVVRLTSNTFESSAAVVGLDSPRDLAILQTSTVPTESLSMIDISAVDAGITVWAIGYPPNVSGVASLSKGILSRIFVRNGFTTVQTDASVNPGNSGGPLTDGCGRVVGLVQAKSSAANTEGLGYALATLEIRRGIETARQTPPSSVPSTPPTSTTAPSITGLTGSISAYGRDTLLIDLTWTGTDASRNENRYLRRVGGVWESWDSSSYRYGASLRNSQRSERTTIEIPMTSTQMALEQRWCNDAGCESTHWTLATIGRSPGGQFYAVADWHRTYVGVSAMTLGPGAATITAVAGSESTTRICDVGVACFGTGFNLATTSTTVMFVVTFLNNTAPSSTLILTR